MNRSKVHLVSLGELALILLFCLIVVVLPDLWKTKDELALAKDKLAQTKEEQAKLSNIPPDCGYFLFSVTVKGRNTFEIDGSELTITQIGQNYDQQIKTAEEERCRHKVRTKAAEGLDLKTYLRAVKKLEWYFYAVAVLE